MANIALNKPSGGQLILSPEDGTSTETVTIPSVGVGKVLQVVNHVNSLNQGISSGSGVFVATNTAATITPLRSDSKIVVFVAQSYFHDGTSEGTGFRLFRDSTPLNIAQGGFSASYNGIYNRVHGYTPLNWVDTPNTTNPITYTVYAARWGSAAVELQYANDQSPSTIIIMEVAA